MDQGKEECIKKKLMEYGVLTRRMKEKLIPELTEQCNQTITEEEVDNLAEDLFKMTCTPEDFETGKSMLELPEDETAQDIDSLLTVFAEKLNLNEDAGLTVAEPMDDVAEESVNEGVAPMDEDKGVDRKRRSDELDADELGAEESDPKKVKENEGLFGGSPENIDSYSEKYNPMHGDENINTEEIKLEEKDVGESIKPEEKRKYSRGAPRILVDGPRPKYLGGSPEEGREATPYLYIILGLAIKDIPNMAYEQILTILKGAMKLSEMLSNKDNCIDDFLKSMIDKRILSFFKYYVIGEIALSSNPLTLMTSLMDITLNLLPYAKTALGMAIVSSLGYFIHHYINHYGGQVKDSIVEKLEELKTGLDELDSKTSEEVVEKTNEKIKNSIESIKEVLKEKEIAKDGELQQIIGENMTNEKEELQKHIGEFDDTMDMEQLKDKLKKKAEEEVPMEQAVPVAAEEAEDEELEGGKKKKKKGGATKKKKTNTKGKKKASKSKKSKTKKTRKTRKTRKNKK